MSDESAHAILTPAPLKGDSHVTLLDGCTTPALIGHGFKIDATGLRAALGADSRQYCDRCDRWWKRLRSYRKDGTLLCVNCRPR